MSLVQARAGAPITKETTNPPVQFLAAIAVHYFKQRHNAMNEGSSPHTNKCFPQISCCIFLQMEKNEDWGMMEKRE